MHIGFDGLQLGGHFTGVQHAAARLLAALCKSLPPEDSITAVLPKDSPISTPDRPPPERAPMQLTGEYLLPKRLQQERTGFRGRARAVRTLWKDWRLESFLRRHRCDVLLEPFYTLPTRLTHPAVVCVHDLIALTHPALASRANRLHLKRRMKRSLDVAGAIVAPTAFVREEICRLYKLPPERITVIPWGVSERFFQQPTDSLCDTILETYRLPRQYVLYVGAIESKKNLEALLRAFFAARVNSKLTHKLVIVGDLGYRSREVHDTIHFHGMRGMVEFTGYLPTEALPAIYHRADLVCMPSKVEGFGMPVLEAQAAGVPVLISHAPALREVAGPDMPAVDAEDLKAMRVEIEKFCTDGVERDRVGKLGRTNARRFTWEKTAQGYRAACQQALESFMQGKAASQTGT
ncbi:MAG: glycosyltransferase family 4 protein [Planctomycetota bacterium]